MITSIMGQQSNEQAFKEMNYFLRIKCFIQFLC